MSQDAISLKFRSDTNEIDASTLGHVLLSLSTIAQVVNRVTNPGAKLDVRVSSSKPGSFIADLAVVVGPVVPIVSTLLTPEHIKSAGEIVKSVAEVLSIKKELKGEQPEKLQKGEETEDGKFVFRNNGNAYVFNADSVNLYIDNPEIPREVSNIGSTLESNSQITGFEIDDAKGNVQFAAEKHEFPALARHETQYLPSSETRIITRRHKLIIVSISFEEELMSRFLYQGNRIGARISDTNFYDKINDGTEGFFKGDILDVELSIPQNWDQTLNAYVDGKQYEIPVVHEHISRPKGTARMNFDDDEF